MSAGSDYTDFEMNIRFNLQIANIRKSVGRSLSRATVFPGRTATQISATYLFLIRTSAHQSSAHSLSLYYPHIKGPFDRRMVGSLNTHRYYFARFQRVDYAIHPKPCSSVIRCGLGIVAFGRFFQ